MFDDSFCRCTNCSCSFCPYHHAPGPVLPVHVLLSTYYMQIQFLYLSRSDKNPGLLTLRSIVHVLIPCLFRIHWLLPNPYPNFLRCLFFDPISSHLIGTDTSPADWLALLCVLELHSQIPLSTVQGLSMQAEPRVGPALLTRRMQKEKTDRLVRNGEGINNQTHHAQRFRSPEDQWRLKTRRGYSSVL